EAEGRRARELTAVNDRDFLRRLPADDLHYVVDYREAKQLARDVDDRANAASPGSNDFQAADVDHPAPLAAQVADNLPDGLRAGADELADVEFCQAKNRLFPKARFLTSPGLELSALLPQLTPRPNTSMAFRRYGLSFN